MKEEEKLDTDTRNLVLQNSQMIFIPKNVGISNIAIDQRRVVYINHFAQSNINEFMPAADNITSINSIHNMIAGPMISQGDVTGLILFYNSESGFITMNTVKKLKAISKLLGGCVALASITTE